MASADWRTADSELKAALEAATPQQRQVAATTGLQLTAKTPMIVAAAQLREALRVDLRLPPRGPVSDESIQLVNQLWVGSGGVVVPRTREEADGWIEYLFLKRRRTALRALAPMAGDVVATSGGEHAEITSIGGNGRLYFRGGMGSGAWPDQVSMVARATDKSPSGNAARKKALNAASMGRPASAWSIARGHELRAFSVDDHVTDSQLLQLESVLDGAGDERPIQSFLENNPALLGMLAQRSERYVLSQKRLGSQFVPDFVVGDVDSLGIHWFVVELEAPNVPVYLKDGSTLGAQARKGVKQIDDWREWLVSNVAYARQSPSDNGLGLFDIRGDAQALVLVGRRSSLITKNEAARQQLRSHGIHVHTYDWLLDSIRGAIQYSGPSAGNPFTVGRTVP